MTNTSMGDEPEVCWIETISPNDAEPDLGALYDHVGGAHGKIHNLYRAFSLQPKPLIAADQHYRDILHNKENETVPWFLELLATQVAILANCTYAFQNHGANFKTLLGDDVKGEAMLQAVRDSKLDDPGLFDAKQTAFLKYGEKLSLNPESASKDDIVVLRKTGASDTEILEAVQATACFAYWVRFINGLGIQLGTETIGLFDKDGNSRGNSG